MRVKRSLSILAAMLAALALLLAGCGGGGDPDDPDDPEDDTPDPYFAPIVEVPGAIGNLADIFKIGDYDDFDEEWEYNFEDDMFLDLVKIGDGISALKVEYDADDSDGAYRMQLNFADPVDISEFGKIELDFYTDTQWDEEDSMDIVLSLFVGDKIMFFENVKPGKNVIDIGTKLWFKEKDLEGFEIWSASGGDFNLYITRVEFTGAALPDPIEGAPVDATGVFVTMTAGGTSGTGSITIPSGENNIPGKSDYAKVYVYFDAPGKDVLTVEVTYTHNGNISWWSVFNAAGEWGLNESGTGISYITWGNNAGSSAKTTPSIQFLYPIGHNTAEMDTSTLKCITFELQAGNFSVTKVTFR